MESVLKKTMWIINRIIDIAAVLSFVGTFLLVIINVIGRYVTYLGSLSWSEEGARYLFICTCCFGLIQVTRKREHFAISMLVDLIPPVAKKVCNLLVNISMMALAGMLFHGSLLMASFTTNNKSSALGIPTCTLYFLEAFAALGIILCVAKITLEDLFGKRFCRDERGDDMSGSLEEKE